MSIRKRDSLEKGNCIQSLDKAEGSIRRVIVIDTTFHGLLFQLPRTNIRWEMDSKKVQVSESVRSSNWIQPLKRIGESEWMIYIHSILKWMNKN